jgi:hypothetical protein
MKFIERLRRGYRAAVGDGNVLSALDDRYWGSIGTMTAAGVRVSPDRALSLAAVYACVRVVSETLASFPLIVYRRLPDGGKERAIDHPLYSLLHDKPNSWMTAFEWLELMQSHIEMRGNAYSFIQPGTDRAIDELLPIHPDRVTRQEAGEQSTAISGQDTGRADRHVRAKPDSALSRAVFRRDSRHGNGQCRVGSHRRGPRAARLLGAVLGERFKARWSLGTSDEAQS